MRIEHLSLMNWRNFRSVDIAVGDRLYVVGPNASGKSNLLDALRFLRDIAAVGGGLQHALRIRGGLKHVRCLAAPAADYEWIGIAITLRSGGGGPVWTYRLHVMTEQRGLHRPIVSREVVTKDGRTVMERPDADDVADQERLTQTALEQVTANREFRTVAELLNGVHYLHLVPQIVRDPRLGVGRHDDPFGSDFLVRIARTSQRTRTSRMARINRALRLAVPQLEDLSLVLDGAGKPHLQIRYKHWRPSEAKLDERDMSDGNLRLIGLLWMIQVTSDRSGQIILLEEPELTLHTSIVRWLPTMLHRAARRGGAQVILSTHSSELLVDPGLGLDEVVVLRPGPDGTAAGLAADIQDVEALIDAGLDLAEILVPKTAPDGIDRLSIF